MFGQICGCFYPTSNVGVVLSSRFCNEIDKLMRHFVWNGKSSSRSLNLLSWNTPITPKRFGGLGLRDAHLLNLALLSKLT